LDPYRKEVILRPKQGFRFFHFIKKPSPVRKWGNRRITVESFWVRFPPSSTAVAVSLPPRGKADQFNIRPCGVFSPLFFFLLYILLSVRSRIIQKLAVLGETRAVTRTVPRMLRAIVFQCASEMRTSRCSRCEKP